MKYGALLCNFRLLSDGNNPLSANCRFQDIDNLNWDNFTVTVPKYPDNLNPSSRSNSLDLLELSCSSFSSYKDGQLVHNTTLLSLQDGYRHDLTFKSSAALSLFGKARLELMAFRPFDDRKIAGEVTLTVKQRSSLPLLSIQDDLKQINMADELKMDFNTNSGDVWISPSLSLVGDGQGDITISLEGFGFSKDVYIQAIHPYLTTCVSPVLVLSN